MKTKNKVERQRRIGNYRVGPGLVETLIINQPSWNCGRAYNFQKRLKNALIGKEIPKYLLEDIGQIYASLIGSSAGCSCPYAEFFTEMLDSRNHDAIREFFDYVRTNSAELIRGRRNCFSFNGRFDQRNESIANFLNQEEYSPERYRAIFREIAGKYSPNSDAKRQ